MPVELRQNRRMFRTRWVWIAYWLALFIATHYPRPPGVGLPIPGGDKAIHFALYLVLALLGGRYLRTVAGRPNLRLLLVWACIYVAYAALDEWLQQFVERSMSFNDWLADVIGIATATSVLALWPRSAGRTELGPGDIPA